MSYSLPTLAAFSDALGRAYASRGREPFAPATRPHDGEDIAYLIAC